MRRSQRRRARVSQPRGLLTGKVNVNGGAIAIGHSIGRVHAYWRRSPLRDGEADRQERSRSTLYIGGGMSIAVRGALSHLRRGAK